jgi:hypothetical protein
MALCLPFPMTDHLIEVISATEIEVSMVAQGETSSGWKAATGGLPHLFVHTSKQMTRFNHLPSIDNFLWKTGFIQQNWGYLILERSGREFTAPLRLC